MCGGNTGDASGRLLSLDALRGYDMLFIMGGEGLVGAIAALFGYADFRQSFGHVPWDGLQFMDTVFPLFLFISGVSFPFSCAKSRERGLDDRAIALKCFWRFLILAVFGVLGGLLRFKFESMRVWSVLGRIGLAWMFASWMYLYFRTKVRLIIAALILVSVPIFFILVPAPDAATLAYPDSLKYLEQFGRGPFSPVGNFGCWLDRTLTGGHIYKPLFDPEGFAGILPAVVTAMLGGFAGEIVRRGGGASGRKALALFACGVGCAIGAWIFSLILCPINKALWSSSFVLAVGSYSFVIFALFYWIVDVWKVTKWSFFFRVIGMNSITIYMAQQIIGFHRAKDFFFGGFANLCPDAYGLVVQHLGYICVCWCFLFFLYRKDVFLRI